MYIINYSLNKPVSSAPLVSFRIIFGAVMVFSAARFMVSGWIEDHFVDIQFTFKYTGFEWVELLPPVWMYAIHVVMLLAAIGITIGLWYRVSAIVFFLSFTYVELIDLTWYLNHYYFVSLVSFLLIFVPANTRLSVDAWRNPAIRRMLIPRWTVWIFKFQIAVVYISAGLAKIRYDWLINALPLKIWVPANSGLPIIGKLMAWKYSPWLFSWFGMLYDSFIVFFLSWKKTRMLAYLSVIVFHGLTGWMFQIGVFPLVMVGATWIYFSEHFHEKLISFCERKLSFSVISDEQLTIDVPKKRFIIHRSSSILLYIFIAFQLLFPWRYLLYDGNLFWTERGYRFGWRVMLMEKAGTATFYVKDQESGREGIVDNREFLHPHQEKQMAMQPDMILQFSHFLADHYNKEGVANPAVRAEVYVTLNGRPSRLLIDPNVHLSTLKGDEIYQYIQPRN
ncbi:MAG: HTTM domain-containing protein [Bacteroidia bacterium]